MRRGSAFARPEKREAMKSGGSMPSRKGGEVEGSVWRPSRMAERRFRASSGFSRAQFWKTSEVRAVS